MLEYMDIWGWGNQHMGVEGTEKRIYQSHNFDITRNNKLLHASNLYWEVSEQPSGSDGITQACERSSQLELPKRRILLKAYRDTGTEETPTQAKPRRLFPSDHQERSWSIQTKAAPLWTDKHGGRFTRFHFSFVDEFIYILALRKVLFVKMVPDFKKCQNFCSTGLLFDLSKIFSK